MWFVHGDVFQCLHALASFQLKARDQPIKMDSDAEASSRFG